MLEIIQNWMAMIHTESDVDSFTVAISFPYWKKGNGSTPSHRRPKYGTFAALSPG